MAEIVACQTPQMSFYSTEPTINLPYGTCTCYEDDCGEHASPP